MGLRRLARSIVMARAERQAQAAGTKVKAHGKFRRWCFRNDWETCRWHTPAQAHKSSLSRFAEKMGVSL